MLSNRRNYQTIWGTFILYMNSDLIVDLLCITSQLRNLKTFNVRWIIECMYNWFLDKGLHHCVMQLGLSMKNIVIFLLISDIMYKRACEDSRSGARLKKDEVERKLRQFQKSLEELERQRENLETGNDNHFDYLTHLIVSLNRLMALARWYCYELFCIFYLYK